MRNAWMDHGNMQVVVYDDRLEITSPGKLPIGQTLERMKEGYPQILAEALADGFSYIDLIEHWGSGITRIIGKVKVAGLREPGFIGGEVGLRIDIYRGQISANNDNADKVPENRRETADKWTGTEDLQICAGGCPITTAQVMGLLGIKQRRAREILVKMVEDDQLRKEGASRSMIYVIDMEAR